MEMKSDQKLKGNNNQQMSVVISGDINIGLKREDVICLIQEFCYTDKEQIIDIVKEVIESLDNKNCKMPDKRVFVPMIQQLSYSLDDDFIKNTYKNLLKSSMDKTKIVHPSFISIIGQLNSDEIKILNSMNPSALIPIPLINIRMKIGEMQGDGVMVIRHFSNVGYGICDNPEKICVYLENMERLKLIEIPPMKTLIDKKSYEQLKNHPAVLKTLELKAKIDGIKYEYDEQFFRLTQFGVEFINACK